MKTKAVQSADLLDEPILAALVERAVAPYRALLSANQLEALRSVLAIQLASQPVLSRAYATIKPRVPPLASGEVTQDGTPEVLLGERPAKLANRRG